MDFKFLGCEDPLDTPSKDSGQKKKHFDSSCARSECARERRRGGRPPPFRGHGLLAGVGVSGYSVISVEFALLLRDPHF